MREKKSNIVQQFNSSTIIYIYLIYKYLAYLYFVELVEPFFIVPTKKAWFNIFYIGSTVKLLLINMLNC